MQKKRNLLRKVLLAVPIYIWTLFRFRKSSRGVRVAESDQFSQQHCSEEQERQERREKKRVKLDMLYFMPGLALEVKGTYLLLLPSIQVKKKRGGKERERWLGAVWKDGRWIFLSPKKTFKCQKVFGQLTDWLTAIGNHFRITIEFLKVGPL